MRLVLLILLPISLLGATTERYVDPDWGGTQSGTASEPWTSLTSARWSTIDTDLASGDVIVYFSAREASSDTHELSTATINVSRGVTNANRVTLTGMDKYNDNDSTPNWVAYSGTSRFTTTNGSPVTTGTAAVKRNNITIRGFRLFSNSSQGLYYAGGDSIIVESNYCRHITGAANGPALYFEYAFDAGAGPDLLCTNITFRWNTVEDCFGESIYIGGVENTTNIGHLDVTVEFNVIKNPGTFGGEADGIDIKDGTRNMIVRGNTISNDTQRVGRDGIIVECGGTIERNFIHSFGRNGITLSHFWNTSAYGSRTNTKVINNIIAHCGGSGSFSQDYGIFVDSNTGGGNNLYVGLLLANNTIYNIYTLDGLKINSPAECSVINNLIFNCAADELDSAVSALTNHSDNLIWDTTGGTIVRTNGTTFTTATISSFEASAVSSDPLLVNAITNTIVAADFALASSSPARNTGITLSDFSNDYDNVLRPQGSAWDMGALEYNLEQPPEHLRFSNRIDLSGRVTVGQ